MLLTLRFAPGAPAGATISALPRSVTRLGRVNPKLLSPIQHRSETGQRELVKLKVREALVRGRNAGGFVSRATIEDAPREITDAASLLEPLPGVHVRRLGADDSFATLSIRGSSSSIAKDERCVRTWRFTFWSFPSFPPIRIAW